MRIIRDYQCSGCGATKEEFVDSQADWRRSRHHHWDDGPRHSNRLSTKRKLCGYWEPQLSPTPTTFTFADRSGHKRART